MMSHKWKLVFSDMALKSIKKMDRAEALLILGYLKKSWKTVQTPDCTAKSCKLITKVNGVTV